MRLGRAAVCLVLGFGVVASALCWDDDGHMAIAEIAYRHLTPAAKAEADRLVGIGATPRTSDFVDAACWADDVRRDRQETGPWHYIDYYFRQDGKPVLNKPDAENVVWAIHKFKAVLEDKSKSDSDRAEALRFLLHFVGDIHQPLHATSRETEALPQGDAGGNKVPIDGSDVPGAGNRPPNNLHALWDLGCGLFPSQPRSFRPLDAQGKASIEALATKIETDEPRNALRAVGDPLPEDWAREGFDISKAFVYGVADGSKPSAEYLQQGQKICEMRAAEAGYRLADLLNAAFADAKIAG